MQTTQEAPRLISIGREAIRKSKMMIQDRRKIEIRASSHDIFDLIDRMPNKFPIYKFLEVKPFFFLRILLVDGLSSAWKAARLDRSINELKLSVGDKMGPFTLTGFERPKKYWFSLESLFFNCRTGYSLSANDNGAELSFDLIADNPTFKEKVWWFLFKPFHGLFAKKVLNVIKEKVEHNQQIQETQKPRR
jgi:hypothetical protein